MSVEYTGCEPCLLGSQEAINRCECREACLEVLPTEEELQAFDECIDECEERYSDDPLNYDYCTYACELDLEEGINQCLQECGPSPSQQLNIIGFQYILVAAWARIPFDPRDNQDNWAIDQITQPIESSFISTINWILPNPWPEVYPDNNTCYGVRMIIFYQDQNGQILTCTFTDWECNFIG